MPINHSRDFHRVMRCLLGSLGAMFSVATASAHISYSGRTFGNFAGSENKAVVISNQGITGAHGWADATDEDWGDSHKGRFFRFTLLSAATVTIKVEAFDDGGTKIGTLKPAFTVYSGLAHLPPAQPDHDGAPISVAYLDSVAGTQEGNLRTLTSFDIGNEDATLPYDFQAMMSHFTYVGHAADGTAATFGTAAGIQGDGTLDGVVQKAFDLAAGDYTIFVGGAEYANADVSGTYGAKVTVSVGPNPGSGVTPADSTGLGMPYQWKVMLEAEDEAELVAHVGAWSWQDSRLFAEGDPPVGWTHTSAWAALTLNADSHLTVHMARQAGVPWPSVLDPSRPASTSSMFPSFTIWQNWDEDGDQFDSYNNRGNIEWAEKLVFIGYVDNSTEAASEKSFNLPAGKYTIVFGSNSPAVNSERQGFKATLVTTPMAQTVALTDGSVPGLTGVTFKALGSPTMNDAEQIAFRATLAGTGVTLTNDMALLSDTGATPLLVVAREGDTDPITGGQFVSFSDPVTDNADNVLFAAKLKPKMGGVSAKNDTGLWRYVAATGSYQLIAREGDPAPGCDDGACFGSFGSAAADSGGGAFVAKLIIRGRVNANNDEGVWLFNESGFVTLLTRQGKPFTVGPGDVRLVKNLHFLVPMPVVKAAGRSTSAAGGRVLNLVFKDGSSGIFHIAP